MPTDTPDADLMQAFAAGDSRAFETLYQRHHAALYRFVKRLMGKAGAAQVDEVFQDTWERAIAARKSWQPGAATWRTWLFTLAHNRAVDCLRKLGREVSTDATEADDAPWEPEASAWAGWPSAQPGHDAADTAFWRAAGQRLLDCLEELPVPQKTAFLLHHEDGLGVDDMARSLECGFETMKTRLRYAMSKLRTCMGAYLPQGAAR